MKNIISIIIFFSVIQWSSQAQASEDLPVITNAQNQANDPWFPYIKRPLLKSLEARRDYSPELLEIIPQRTTEAIQHVPWTLLPPKGKKDPGPFKLKDIVPDRIKDPKTGKDYVKLYHATTSDLLNVFKQGAKAIRFDVAELTALGMGFYLAADINEAKYYGCERLGTRKYANPNLKALLLVIGVLEDDLLQGKWAKPDTRQSDDKTGESNDKDVFFVRNEDRHNQFVFFKNSAPYMKIFKAITLDDGFGKAQDRQDGDGLPQDATLPDSNHSFKCWY